MTNFNFSGSGASNHNISQWYRQGRCGFGMCVQAMGDGWTYGYLIMHHRQVVVGDFRFDNLLTAWEHGLDSMADQEFLHDCQEAQKKGLAIDFNSDGRVISSMGR